MDKKTVKRGLLPYLFIALLMFGMFYMFDISNRKVHELTYDEFVEKLDEEIIEELEIIPRASGYTYEVRGTLKTYEDGEMFESVLPLSDEIMKKIVEASDNQDFKLTTQPDPSSSSLLYVLVNVLPIAILILAAIWLLNRQMAGNKSSMDFGKSRARLNSDNNKVTFKDVAGLKEEKEECNYLKSNFKQPSCQ